MSNSGLVIYGRQRCHLCEEMYEDLQPFLRGYSVPLEEVDVDTDERLRARFGLRVPVLVADGEELCHGRLDVSAVTAWLQALDSG